MAKTKYGKYGVYLSPVVVRGAYLSCELRGLVKIVGESQGPIAWPIGEKNAQRALVIYKGLARALRLEPAEIVAAWWGLDVQAVRRWQSGTPEPLLPLQAPSSATMLAAAGDDGRRAWDAPAEKVAPPPQNPQRSTDKPQAGSSETGSLEANSLEERPPNWFPPILDEDPELPRPREKRRKRRWEAWEDDLVRTCPVQEVVLRTKRNVSAVWARRFRLGVSLPRGDRLRPSLGADGAKAEALVAEPVSVRSQAPPRRGRAGRMKSNTTVRA